LVRADRIYRAWSVHSDLVMARYKGAFGGEAGGGVSTIQTWVRAFSFRLELISQALLSPTQRTSSAKRGSLCRGSKEGCTLIHSRSTMYLGMAVCHGMVRSS
jgi:hypothetical protein